MTTKEEQKIDPNSYKGILPAHMRQGIPPYLQILFAARPKLPFIPPIQKPHKLVFNGYNNGVDIAEMKAKSDELRLKMEQHKSEESLNKNKSILTSLLKSKRSEKWKLKFQNHISQQKQQNHAWIQEKNMYNQNKSADPKNTLIISNLVQ